MVEILKVVCYLTAGLPHLSYFSPNLQRNGEKKSSFIVLYSSYKVKILHAD